MKAPTHRNGVRMLQPATKGFRDWLRAINHCSDRNDLVAGHAASRVSHSGNWPRTESLAELRAFALRAYGHHTAAEITAAWREWRQAREMATRQARGEQVELPLMRYKNAPVGGVRWYSSDEPVPTPEGAECRVWRHG